MKIQIPQRIRAEDYKSDEQDMVSKLARVISPFLDNVYAVLNKGIDFDNLNRQLVDIDITIDSSGNLVNPPQIKNTTNGSLRGINVINAINLVKPGVYPTTSPFVSWSINGNIINVLNVTGLQASSQYRLTLELIG
jgi:hypothetical protein